MLFTVGLNYPFVRDNYSSTWKNLISNNIESILRFGLSLLKIPRKITIQIVAKFYLTIINFALKMQLSHKLLYGILDAPLNIFNSVSDNLIKMEPINQLNDFVCFLDFYNIIFENPFIKSFFIANANGEFWKNLKFFVSSPLSKISVNLTNKALNLLTKLSDYSNSINPRISSGQRIFIDTLHYSDLIDFISLLNNILPCDYQTNQEKCAFAQAILQAAPDYKYRLMFPILDLEDMQKVNVNTVLDHQDQVLAEASSRYGADYFIAAAISSVPNESGVTLKWNLYNRDGIAIANSSLSGVMDEVATLGAGDIARALMTFQEKLDHGTETVNQLKANNVDIEMLGPGEGFVRMRIGNIRTLQDIKGIRSAFATYGFDGDTRVVGYDNGQFVIEIATNSNPTNIEGTLRHGGDFTYLGPWSFNFRNSSSGRAPLNTTVSSARSDRPNSQLSTPVNTPAPSGALSSR